MRGVLKKGDIGLFLLLNRKLHCELMNLLMRGVTRLGSLTFAVALPLILMLFGRHSLGGAGLEMAASLTICQGITQLIKRLVNRPRPYITIKNIIPVDPPPCRYSFPSGHTSTAFTLALVMAAFVPGLSALFYFLASMVGLSRVYLGVHYPSDVLAGVATAYAAFIIGGGVLVHVF